MKYVVELIIILAVVASLFGGGYFIKLKDAAIDFLSLGRASENKSQQLLLENESLKAKILSFQISGGEPFKKSGLDYKPAKIYSTYPFNHHDLFTINLGSDDGISVFMPVAAAIDVLIGQVIEVYPKYSVVRSIFDVNFKTAVKIGASPIDALLAGGNTPMITMISKNSDIKSGDYVYNAGLGFPYGMKIGSVDKILTDNAKDFFKNVSLGTAYNPNVIGEVLVITNYKVLSNK
ncbi:MAG: Uncharacterized protein Athens071426_545 [Parcubacteria group bacterium Athens0714_26]|nr:MAG: Uncharacterized protein Athens101426_695 [Parcubacteria group bacterium Athens1014_26]TSD02207.1 MAG: Uncharacterized protein Athens071426_545 [Parcubacteria group bacterium Athens0714_26]